MLPQVWRFKHLSTLMITGLTENSTTRELPSDCGITGTIPLAWPTQRQLPQLRYLYMPNNKLSGPLHPSYGTWRTVVAVWLEKNLLTGSIPAQYAAWGLQRLRLSFNQLQGTLPSFATGAKPSLIQQSLTRLYLDNNQISGELHLSCWQFHVS